ncbi:MAG: hypothetical protein NE330_13040, partial [Lentisphaeraceae bacterium]|nr:hypothetical protein [Lentisphaeraceae bacterium]
IVSGLDNRFKASVPIYGCGFLSENSCWLKDFARMGPQNTKKWVNLWDPKQYVGSAVMPMLFVNGGQDFAYPPDSHAKTYGLVKSDKNLRFTPTLPHGHIFDKPKAVQVFIDHHLKGTDGLHKVTDLKTTNSKVIVIVETEHSLKSAKLHYTMDKLPGDNKKRKWQSVDAQIDKYDVSSQLPPAGASIWFLTVTDERDLTVSTPLQFK